MYTYKTISGAEEGLDPLCARLRLARLPPLSPQLRYLYSIGEQPAPAPHLAHPDGYAADALC